MRHKKSRPWLTSTGVEIPTAELRVLSRDWDQSTWEKYLNWYESSRNDALLPPDIFFERAERMTTSVFQQLDHDSDPKKQEFCEHLLRSLPKEEAKVLRHTYFDGLTVREIAAFLNSPKSTVQLRKKKGLLRLQRGHGGETLDTRRYMRGTTFEANQNAQNLWDLPLSFSIREDRVYDPGRCKEELAKINHSGLRAALTELSERELRILYLRFWCDYSATEIARELRSGVNLIDQLIEAAISKLKRRIVREETGALPGEGPSCA